LPHQTDKQRWGLDHIPAGDAHAPYIKQLSDDSDGSHCFYVYRDCKAIGSVKGRDLEETLGKAQQMAQLGKGNVAAEQAIEAMRTYVRETPRDAKAYQALPDYAKKVLAVEQQWMLPGFDVVAPSRRQSTRPAKRIVSTSGVDTVDGTGFADSCTITVKDMARLRSMDRPQYAAVANSHGKTVGEWRKLGMVDCLAYLVKVGLITIG
jgi:hypothetical protein